MMNEDPIGLILDRLMELDNVNACMIARLNMISVMPVKFEYNFSNLEDWDYLHEIINEFFFIIDKNIFRGIDTIECSIRDYRIIFLILPETENALVVITDKNFDRDLIEIKMKKTRENILKYLQKVEKI